MANITGGGLIENLPRMLEDGLSAQLNLESWPPQDCFEWIRKTAQLDQLEMLRTFNCGIGYVLAVDPEHVNSVLTSLIDAGETPHVIGHISSVEEPPDRNWVSISTHKCEFG